MAPVELDRGCLETLAAHGATQLEVRLRFGNRFEDVNQTSATLEGTTDDSGDRTERVLSPAQIAAGLRRIRFHDLGRIRASLLTYRRESPKYR